MMMVEMVAKVAMVSVDQGEAVASGRAGESMVEAVEIAE